jgi:outer membrane protein OmpA-like peptidoglycan-associated protein/opacity protein-like surface antigen
MKHVLRVICTLMLSTLIASAGFADSPAKSKNKPRRKSSASAAKASLASPAAKPAPIRDESAYHWPRVELFGGYSYVRVNASGKLGGTSFSQSTNLNGGSASLAVYFNKNWAIAGDFGAYHNGDVSHNVDATLYSYLIGPRYSFRNSTIVTPFVQVLIGGVHGSVGIPAGLLGNPTSVTFTQNAFAMTAGGGLDVTVSKHWAIRVIQAEYFLTNFSAPSTVTGLSVNRQNNLRISAGVVLRLGEKEPPPNHPPVASCSVDKSSVVQDSNEVVGVRATASDPDNDPLTYSWSATGGKIEGTDASARWDSAGTAPGTYTVTARVDDGRGGTASCSADINVTPKPIPPPTMSCSVDRSSVLAGERVQVTATANDQSNTPLNYIWQSNGGQIIGTGSSVQFDTTGLAAGSYSITGRVENGKGGAADCSTSVTVQVPPPAPQASKISECSFKNGSARVDNVCKRVLDDVAVRLQNDPKAKIVIVGYADPKETKSKRNKKLAEERGESAQKYLSKEKGVADTRVEVRGAEGQEGAAENRRIDLIFVPDGASY